MTLPLRQPFLPCVCAPHYSKAVVVVRYVSLHSECSLSIDMSVLYTASKETGSSLHIVSGAIFPCNKILKII